MTLLFDLTVWKILQGRPGRTNISPGLRQHYQCVHDRKSMSGPNTKAVVEARRTVISIDSEKTGMRVELPLLQARLNAGPTGDLAFIVTCAARRGPRARW